MDATLKEMLPKIPGYQKERWAVSRTRDEWIIWIETKDSDGWWGGSARRGTVLESIEENRTLIVALANELLAARAKAEEDAKKPKNDDLLGKY